LVKVALYGEGPDVSEIGTTWCASLVAMNALRPFTPGEIASLGRPSAFLPSSWQTGILPGDDQICAVPWLMPTTTSPILHHPAKLGYGAYRIGAVQIVGQGGACQKNGRRSRSVASR
jgi:hypothetical protein